VQRLFAASRRTASRADPRADQNRRRAPSHVLRQNRAERTAHENCPPGIAVWVIEKGANGAYRRNRPSPRAVANSPAWRRAAMPLPTSADSNEDPSRPRDDRHRPCRLRWKVSATLIHAAWRPWRMMNRPIQAAPISAAIATRPNKTTNPGPCGVQFQDMSRKQHRRQHTARFEPAGFVAGTQRKHSPDGDQHMRGKRRVSSRLISCNPRKRGVNARAVRTSPRGKENSVHPTLLGFNVTRGH